MKQQNIERKQLPAIQCEDFSNINESLVTYRKSSNKLLSVDMLNRKFAKHSIHQHIINALTISHERSHQNASTATHYLAHYHLLLADQLNNPRNWGLYPTVDGLSFTLDVTDQELKRLNSFFDKENTEHPKLKITGAGKAKKGAKNAKGKQSYKEEMQERSLYAKTVKVFLKDEDCDPIYVSVGLKGKRGSAKMRPLRISLNPARFTGKQLKKLFKQIRKAQVFNDFDETLLSANVTRLDVAIDFIGVPTPMIIATQGTAVHYSSHPKPGTVENDEKLFVETMYGGDPQKSHFTIYSKVDKQEQRNQMHVVIIKGPDTVPLSIVRFERVYKPQHSGGNLRLQDLADAPCFLKSLKLYSPLAYSRLDEIEEFQALKHGYVTSQMEKNSQWSEISKFFPKEKIVLKQRTLPDGMTVLEKRQSQELRLAKTKMLKELAQYELPVNYDWFAKKQNKLLKKILKLMLNKEHG